MSARRLLQALLLVQLAALMLIACWAVARRGAAPWQGLLLGAGAVVLVRLAINANNFAMAARFASATPPGFRLRPGARLKLLAGEFRASMLQSSWFMPRAAAFTRIHPDSTHPPLLLLHGYGCNSGYWAHLAPLLDAAGISHRALDLEPVAGDIDGYVPLVERAVEELRREARADKVAIVAHSMGGLVARAWMRTHGSGRVARLITLGTPHAGTALAQFGLGASAAQMRRARDGQASPWLRALDASEDAATRALITSIYTHHDNIVAPQTSSRLEGARNVEFGGIGHVALGSHPRVLAQVMRELAALDVARPAAPDAAAAGAEGSPAPALANSPVQPTLLIVDDDAFMREVLADALGRQPWRLLCAASAEEALALLARESVQVILSDQCMPGLHGTELLAQAWRLYPQTVRLILSGQSELEAIERARAAGVVDGHLAKPWNASALREALREAFVLQRRRADGLPGGA